MSCCEEEAHYIQELPIKCKWTLSLEFEFENHKHFEGTFPPVDWTRCHSTACLLASLSMSVICALNPMYSHGRSSLSHLQHTLALYHFAQHTANAFSIILVLKSRRGIQSVSRSLEIKEAFMYSIVLGVLSSFRSMKSVVGHEESWDCQLHSLKNAAIQKRVKRLFGKLSDYLKCNWAWRVFPSFRRVWMKRKIFDP